MKALVERLLPSCLRRWYDPEDILQEACLAILSHPSRWSSLPEEKRGRWFKGVLQIIILNRLRAHRKAGGLPGGDSPKPGKGRRILEEGVELEALVSKAPSAESQLAAREELLEVLKEIYELDSISALLVIHSCIDHLKMRQSARRLGIEARKGSHLLSRAWQTIYAGYRKRHKGMGWDGMGWDDRFHL